MSSTRPLRSFLAPGLFLLGFLGLVPSARADGEVWVWSESRLPLATQEQLGVRTSLRLVSDARFNGRSGGLDTLFFRAGPLFDLTPWLFLGVHGTAQALQNGEKQFIQEIRGELEPNFYWKIGDFSFNDRNRFELRFRDVETRYRYRNQLRANYAPAEQPWMLFIWDELLFDLSGYGFNQNRAMLGVGYSISPSTRFEFGYMLRSRKTDEIWDHDHIAAFNVFFDGWKR